MKINNVEDFLLNVGFSVSNQNDKVKTFEIEEKDLKAFVFNNSCSICHIRKNNKLFDFKELLFKSGLISEHIYKVLCSMEKLEYIIAENNDNKVALNYYMLGEELIHYQKSSEEIDEYISEVSLFFEGD